MVSISLYAFQGIKQVIFCLQQRNWSNLRGPGRLRSDSLHFDLSLVAESAPPERCCAQGAQASRDFVIFESQFPLTTGLSSTEPQT